MENGGLDFLDSLLKSVRIGDVGDTICWENGTGACPECGYERVA